MGRILACTLLLTGLLVAPLCPGASPVEQARPAAGVDRLIEQLGHRDYRVRESANQALAARGPEVLPALRKAQDHGDPEVRRRLRDLIAPLEHSVLLAPKRISMNLTRRPLREAVDELIKQTGYKIEVWNGGNNDQVYDFQFDKVPFWEAVDRLCAATGMVVQHGWGDDRLRLQLQESQVPYVHHGGLFRVVAEGFQHHRSIQFGEVPRNFLAPGQRSEYVYLSLSVAAEPKLPLLGVGAVKLTAAVDDQNNSLVPAEHGPLGSHQFHSHFGRGLSQQTQVSLAPPARDAHSLRLVRGSIPVTLLVEQKPLFTVEDVLKAKGRTFKAENASLVIEDFKQTPEKIYQVQLSLSEARQTNPHDYSWINSVNQRIELLDAKGNKYHSHGTNWRNTTPTSLQGTFMFGNAGNAKLGPPARFVYYTWNTMQHQVAFEFRDLPLP